jgi:hypothetical protein
VISGETQSFTVTPNSNYQIGSVTGCGGTLNGNTYTTNVITAPCTVTAGFAPSYTVTASSNIGGTVNPSGPVSATAGATKTFTVTPNNPITGASAGGTCGISSVGINTWTTKPITGNCTFVVSFNSGITASAGIGGMIIPSGLMGVSNGTSKTFTITPNSGYKISTVGGTCGGTLNGNTYTTKAITTSCTVTAAFTK